MLLNKVSVPSQEKKNSVTNHYLGPISFPWLHRFQHDPISKKKDILKRQEISVLIPKKYFNQSNQSMLFFRTAFVFEQIFLCESPSVLPHKLANGWCHALGHLAPQLLYFFWQSILGWQEQSMFGRRDLDLENFFHSFLSSYTPLKLNMGTHLKIGHPLEWILGDSELGVPIMASGEPC